MKPESPVLAIENSGNARLQRSIGAILVDSGKLSLVDAERVLRLQREEDLRFGDAAVKLGLLTQDDVDRVLSAQFDYSYLQRGGSSVSESVIAAYDPFSSEVEALRALRSQLLLRWFDITPARKALAIVSGEAEEGKSFVSANLAVVFSQLGQRTLLIDADMRHATQHKLFGVDNHTGLSAAISGRGGPVGIQDVPGLANLWLLPAGATPPNPVELLCRPLFEHLLSELRQKFDVILIDSPRATQYPDAQTIVARAGAALMVVRKNVTRLAHASAIAVAVAQANATMVGAVVNDH